MDQEIEAPSHFLCPISLQLMRDPVIVSTGITYDRESIENWLFSWKNNSCPVTKQPLIADSPSAATSSLTPNHTLRRLIQSWCTLNAVDRIPTPKPLVDEAYVASLLRDLRTRPENDGDVVKRLQRLKSIAAHGGERSKRCLESAGAIECLASTVLLAKNDAARDTAVEILFHLRATSENRLRAAERDSSSSNNLVDSLVEVLKHGSRQSRSHSLALLRTILGASDPTRLSFLKPSLFAELVRLLRDKETVKPALKLLAEVTPWGRNRIKAVVDGGAVPALVETLLPPPAGSEGKRVCELALVVMDQLCGCAEGRAELAAHPAGLAAVSKKILRVSHVASDRAVRVLGSVCKYSGNGRVLQEMLEVGVVAKLCLVVQVDSGSKAKNRAKDILKMHSRVWRASPCVPKHLLSSYPS